MLLILSGVLSLGLFAFIDLNYNPANHITGKTVSEIQASEFTFASYVQAAALSYFTVSMTMGVIFICRT